jgi:putative acetyltransferase
MQPVLNIALTEAHSPADLGAARELFQEYAAWVGFSLDYQNFDEELRTLPGRFRGPQGRLLLARIDGALAGCGALRPLEPRVCEMKRLYVRPEFHGRGVGRALAQRLIFDATKIGYSHMRLDTVSDKMPAAIALYCSLGFYEIPAYYSGARPGTLYLELLLTP